MCRLDDDLIDEFAGGLPKRAVDDDKWWVADDVEIRPRCTLYAREINDTDISVRRENRNIKLSSFQDREDRF